MSATASIAVGYARASTDKQDRSVEDQKKAIEALAHEQGYELLRVFEDEGKGDRLDRDGLLDLLSFVEARPHGGVVLLWKRNRLIRPENPKQGIALEWRIEAAGWGLEFVEGEKSTGEPLLDLIKAGMDHDRDGKKFYDNLAGDVVRGMKERAEDGGLVTGRTPYGLAREVTWANGTTYVVPRGQPCPPTKGTGASVRYVPGDVFEAEIVREVFRRYLEGEGYTGIAADFNRRKVPAPWGRGKGWHHSSVRKLLSCPAYVGDCVWNRTSQAQHKRLVQGRTVAAGADRRRGRKHPPTRWNAEHDWLRVEGVHVALIGREDWDAVQVLRRTRASQAQETRGPVRRGAYPLTGLIRCGACGGPMVGTSTRTRKEGRRRYMCSAAQTKRTCRAYFVYADEIEGAVLERLQRALSPLLKAKRAELAKLIGKKLGTGARPSRSAELQASRVALARKIDNGIENLCESTGATARKLRAKIEEMQVELEKIDQELAHEDSHTKGTRPEAQRIDRALALLDGLRDASTTTPTAALAKLLGEMLDRVLLRFWSVRFPTSSKYRHRMLDGQLLLRLGFAPLCIAGTSEISSATIHTVLDLTADDLRRASKAG